MTNYCTSSNQCDEGDGDCDSDADCKGSLKCGEGNGRDDNCDNTLGFPKVYDCCYDPNEGNFAIITLNKTKYQT